MWHDGVTHVSVFLRGPGVPVTRLAENKMGNAVELLPLSSKLNHVLIFPKLSEPAAVSYLCFVHSLKSTDKQNVIFFGGQRKPLVTRIFAVLTIIV